MKNNDLCQFEIFPDVDSTHTDWLPSLWMEIFNDLLDYELDNEDPWTLHFNYSITDKLTAQEKNRGWKICCTCTQAE